VNFWGPIMPRAPIRAGIVLLFLAAGWAAAPIAIAAPSTVPQGPSASELLKRGLKAQKESRWKDAMRDYWSALVLFRRNNEEENEAGALNNIGVIHKLQGRYGKAREFFDKSLEIHKRLGAWAGMAETIPGGPGFSPGRPLGFFQKIKNRARSKLRGYGCWPGISPGRAGNGGMNHTASSTGMEKPPIFSISTSIRSPG
jgi:tetratricopeptide (TPR) repeat protein